MKVNGCCSNGVSNKKYKISQKFSICFSSVEADACLGFKGYLGKKIGNMSQISNELLGDILHC